MIRTKTIVTLSFSLILFFFLSTPGFCEETWQILKVGTDFNASDINPNLKLNWYGLFETGKGQILKKVKVTVNTSASDASDQGPGKSVSINSKEESLFLIGTTRVLKEGPIAGIKSDRRLESGTSFTINLQKEIVKIEARSQNKKKKSFSMTAEENEYAGYQVLANRDAKKQSIFQCESAQAVPSLNWYGDLDGDGKMDLVLGGGCDDYGDGFFLYLSSPAGEDLFKKVAEWTFGTGC